MIRLIKYIYIYFLLYVGRHFSSFNRLYLESPSTFLISSAITILSSCLQNFAFTQNVDELRIVLLMIN